MPVMESPATKQHLNAEALESYWERQQGRQARWLQKLAGLKALNLTKLPVADANRIQGDIQACKDEIRLIAAELEQVRAGRKPADIRFERKLSSKKGHEANEPELNQALLDEVLHEATLQPA